MRNFLELLVGHGNDRHAIGPWVCLGLMALVGCQAPATDSPMVGADRDSHGCIASAGYVWDDAQQKCARPWEK